MGKERVINPHWTSPQHPKRKARKKEENLKPGVMATKPKLFYFHGRGRMELIHWLLAAAGVEILKDHGEDFLVGNKFSWADIQLLEAILMVEELDASVLSDFPLLKCLLDNSAPL
ncbi:glutathione S-transferase A4-like [Leptonychotes weddellii]|uniref:glutathione transferase n=1 Tax=Leptonychotes weddellii TaxID=9713 RepID=A0A7F8Q383_LEPWE|nr:glutathione S-transferase A4-like [Leptonychotes weddellii]